MSNFKIASWNVNSVRARIEHVVAFLEDHKPDVLLLQETKCENSQFPHDAFTSTAYNIYTHGQKSYNGVAIFSKTPADEVKTNFAGNPLPEEARFLEISCMTSVGYAKIVSVYIPNGRLVGSEHFAIKLDFYDKLTAYLSSIKTRDEGIIIGGDLNVAPFDIDVYSVKDLENSVGFTLDERYKLRALINAGFEDLYRLHNPDTKEFSWWDYRGGGLENDLGMRIDALLATPNLVDKMSKAYIDKSYRALPKPSDHTPVIVEFDTIYRN